MTYASLCDETYDSVSGLPPVPSGRLTKVSQCTVAFSAFFSFAGLLLSQVPLGTFPALTISPSSLPYGALGSSYSAQLTANGSGSYQWSVSQGILPPGLALGPSSGTISGTANTGGTYPFTVTVIDNQTQQTASAKYTVGILNISNTTPLPGGTVGSSYSVTFNASDGPPATYVWSIKPSPPGLNLDSSTGTLSGTPTTSGTFRFNVTVSETASPSTNFVATLSTSKTFDLTIQPATPTSLTISPQSLPFGALGSV